MLFFHALEFSAFWVFIIISALIVLDLVGAAFDNAGPTAVGFIGALLAIHLLGVYDIVSVVCEHWGWAIVGVIGWLVIGFCWMILKYKWFLREGMRDISKRNYTDPEIKKREAEGLSFERHLNELVTWWLFWLPSMFSTFVINAWDSLKFFVVEVCGQWLKGIWKREFDKFFPKAD